MGKRRGKQQNVSVIGLFKLAGRHKKMDDVFVYHECQSTRWSHSAKNKNRQTNSITNNICPRAFYYVCLFFHVPSLYVLSTCSFVCFFTCLPYTFCLLVRLFFFEVTSLYVLSTCSFVFFFK